MQQQNLTILPYTPPNSTNSFKRVLARPISKPESTSDSGLLIPGDIGKICETGEIVAVCEGSTLISGDKILYQKVARNTIEHLDTISIDGEKYDVLYENEIWAVNDYPFHRLFVLPLAGMNVSESGLMIPDSVKGITSKGMIFRAPEDFGMEAGDHIEYRKQERDIYPTIEIGGERYEVLNEQDVFLVNGHAAPYRIVVKIDIAAQRIKRTTSEHGLIRSPLFTAMLYNMQVGEVIEIGKKAALNYPELKVGDQAILHHRVESEQYRVLRQEYSKHDANVVTYEYRVLDGFEENRDVFGRVINRKKGIFQPFGKSLFYEWNFELMEKNAVSDSLFLDFSTNLDKCTDLDDLKSTIAHKKDEGVKKAQAKIKGITELLANTHHEQQKELFQRRESELELAKREAMRVAGHLNTNHLLILKELGGRERVIAPYLTLYPINVLGFKFLIGYEGYVVAKISFVAEEVNSD